jgi:hypothetical protein
MAAFELRVTETGCAGAREGGTQKPACFSADRDFQAFKVWRRLGGALASRAWLASWHSWMAGGSDVYLTFGLREDSGGEDAPSTEALPRPSWFAFQRLASQLANVCGGRMVLPDTRNRAELLLRTQRGPVDPLVVFEYDLDTALPFRFAYLVLADPLAGDTVAQDACAYHAWDGQAGTAVQVPVESGPAVYSLLLMDGKLPSASVTWAAPWSFPVGETLHLRLGDMPVLIKSTARIAWHSGHLLHALTSGGDPAPAGRAGGNTGAAAHALAELYLDRPDWLDDPSAPVNEGRKT